MSGRAKGNGKIARILDLLLTRNKVPFWLPIAVAVIVYVLFLLYGQNPDKDTLILEGPVFALVWCGGIFLVLGIQLINPYYSAKAMDLCELFFVLMMYASAIITALSLFFDVRQGFGDSTLGAILQLSVLSAIHSLRKEVCTNL